MAQQQSRDDKYVTAFAVIAALFVFAQIALFCAALLRGSLGDMGDPSDVFNLFLFFGLSVPAVISAGVALFLAKHKIPWIAIAELILVIAAYGGFIGWSGDCLKHGMAGIAYWALLLTCLASPVVVVIAVVAAVRSGGTRSVAFIFIALAGALLMPTLMAALDVIVGGAMACSWA